MKRIWIAAVSVAAAFVYVLSPAEQVGAVTKSNSTSTGASGTGCCTGTTGNVNGTGIVDLSDLSALVSYLTGGGYVLPCPSAADVNGAGIVDLSDLSALVSYLTGGGFVLPSCSPSTAPSTTKIIPPDSSGTILHYDTTGTVILGKSSSYAQSLSIGDVVIGQNDAQAPNGFLRRVTSKTTIGDSVVLGTAPTTMQQAFNILDIADVHRLKTSDVKSVELLQGANLKRPLNDTTFSLSLSCVFYDKDKDTSTHNDQIRLDGDYTFSAVVFDTIQLTSWLGLQKFVAGIQTSESLNVDLSATIGRDFGNSLPDSIMLAYFHLAAYPLPGAPVVWVRPTLRVMAYISGDLTITLTTSITGSLQKRLGIAYVDNSWSSIGSSSQQFTYTLPQIAAELNFEPAIGLDGSLLFYGVAGPFVNATAGFPIQSALSLDSCVVITADLDFTIDADVGVACDILTVVHLEYSKSFELYNQRLVEWKYHPNGTGTITISPSPSSLNAPWTLTGPCDYSASGTGVTTLEDLNPDTYTVTWGAVAGWTAPPNSDRVLNAGQTITLSGTYTANSGTVTDIDGNVYQTVTIGTQVWMAENLKVRHYRNGDAIPNVTDSAAWVALTTGAYCEYNNDVNNVTTYGRLYNWYAVADGRELAPAGWHVPSDAEWQTLSEFLGGDAVAGGKMKEAGYSHWASPNTGATNESGFSALPGGFRNEESNYSSMGHDAVFWSSTEYNSKYAWWRFLGWLYSDLVRGNPNKVLGQSVRCVRDY